MQPLLLINTIKSKFSPQVLAWASGRINLLGEHIDYNEGYVLPASIQYKTVVGIQPAQESFTFYSFELNKTVVVNNTSKVSGHDAWINYLLGVVEAFQKHGCTIPPFTCAITSSVPVGAGLSSSAALTCSFALALNQWLGLSFSLQQLAKFAQWSEHNYAGVNCGLMDQFASLLGKANSVLLMDCVTESVAHVPMRFENEILFLLDTGVKHELGSSAYNDRRSTCENGLAIIKKSFPEVNSFRDADGNALKVITDKKMHDRCLYVIQEIERTQLATTLIKAGSFKDVGRLMFATHTGLSQLYEVSCSETDFVVSELQLQEGVLGARMMGAGFGGCVLVLAKVNALQGIVEKTQRKYKAVFSTELQYRPVSVEDASGYISIP
ncbi:MAG: galactokinase [Cyclobacteriaceae bacterium]|jgi:galactokinase|nr:galactokinase [Cyclobacteriaceae bacterium]